MYYGVTKKNGNPFGFRKVYRYFSQSIGKVHLKPKH